jgi:chromosome segregation ATPase
MAKRPAKPVKLANETKRLPVENLQKRPDKLKDVKDSKDNVVEVPAGFEPSATQKDHQQDFKNYKDGKDERPEIAQAISPRKPKGPKDKGEVEKAKPEGEKAQQKEIEKVKAEYEKAKEIDKVKPEHEKYQKEIDKVKPELEKAHQKEAEKFKAEYEKFAKEIDKAKPEQEKFHKEIDKVKAEFEKQVKEKEGKEIAETPVDPALREGAAARGDGDKDHFIAPGQRPDLSGGALTGEADKGKPAPKPPSPRKR